MQGQARAATYDARRVIPLFSTEQGHLGAEAWVLFGRRWRGLGSAGRVVSTAAHVVGL